MDIIEPRTWNEIPSGVPFYVVLTDDPGVAVKRFEARWGYKPDMCYHVQGKYWMAKRSDDGEVADWNRRVDANKSAECTHEREVKDEEVNNE